MAEVGGGGLSPQKQAILALEEMQARLDAAERARTEPIAIIGIGCRFPGGVSGPDSFWRLLEEETDAIREVPPGRWDLETVYDPDPDVPGKAYTRHGGFLDDVDTFDAQFFGISPREAVGLDPQQRLLLEVSWEALENANLNPDHLTGTRTGVYVGVMENDYAKLYLQSGAADSLDAYYVTGNHFSFTAGRISYVLGLHGPSVAMDTACSSSLVALHLACQGLRAGETDLALAGGVNLMLSPELTITMCQFKALSADGRCKTFDESADGFGQGEGCGILVLKRLSDAVADGDDVVAVIRGSAVNHDGPSGGLTVPNGHAQQAVLRAALVNAGVRPDQVGYIEAHGTGTSLGDPIELRALGAVFAPERSAGDRLLVGSVKTNIGHLDSAAGVAGVIKVALALRHQEIPAHLHLNQLNSRIDLDQAGVDIPVRRTAWPERDGTRIGGISSFGLSGTNAHVILEQAPAAAQPPTGGEDRPLHLLGLSAKSEPALAELAARYAERLESVEPAGLGDVCVIAGQGRAHFEHRLAVVGAKPAEMIDSLAAFAANGTTPGVQGGRARSESAERIAFLFTGQGAQYVGMGRRLYETEPHFREAMDACDAILGDHLEQPLLSVMFSEQGDSSPLDDTAYTQPALFSLEYSLARLWRSWGIEPSIVMGHSVGEYAAACVAGVFGLEDGLRLIAERGRLMQALAQDGAMAAVLAPLEQVEEAVAATSDLVSVAAVNGPESVVVSGEARAVQSIVQSLEVRNIECRLLNVSHAFHSPLMDPILDAFAGAAEDVHYSSPQIPLLSNMTGEIVDRQSVSLGAGYWRRHVSLPVLFSEGMSKLHEHGYSAFLEIGPNPTLLGMGRRCVPGDDHQLWLPSLRRDRDDWEQMIATMGSLFVAGRELDWEALEGGRGPRRDVKLPTYPFQRQRYWILDESGPRGASRPGRRDGHPLLGDRLASPLDDIQFEGFLSTESAPYLIDHQVLGTAVVPGTALLEMALAGAGAALGEDHELADVSIRQALVLDGPDPKRCPNHRHDRRGRCLVPRPERGRGRLVAPPCHGPDRPAERRLARRLPGPERPTASVLQPDRSGAFLPEPARPGARIRVGFSGPPGLVGRRRRGIGPGSAPRKCDGRVRLSGPPGHARCRSAVRPGVDGALLCIPAGRSGTVPGTHRSFRFPMGPGEAGLGRGRRRDTHLRRAGPR